MDSKRKSRASSDTDSETDSAAQALGKRAQDDLLPHEGSKKRVRKTKEEKAVILQFVDDGGTHSAAAERFGVSRTAVTKIVKERELVAKTRRTEDAQEQVETAEVPSEASETANIQVKDAVEVFGASLEDAAPSHPPVDTVLPEAMSVEMVISTETAADAAVLTVDGDTTVLTAPTGTKPKKGRRVRKTNLEKMEILAFVDQGGSQGAAAEKFGVSRTAVTKMVKERAAISAQALVESSTSSRKVLQYQHKLSIIEDMLYKWQVQVELDAPTLKITGDLLQSKAMEFRNKILADYSSDLSDEIILSLTDFKASNGWLHRYMQRRSIRSLPKNEAAIVAVSPSTPERTSNDQRTTRIPSLYLSAAVPGDGEAASAYIGEGGNERKMYEELFALLKKVPALQKMLGLDFAENAEQLMIELLEFDKPESNGSDELAKDDEIVIESLSAQGLLRDAQRVLVLESIVKDEISPLPTVSEANSAVARLLRFMSQDNDSILTLGERRTGRANLLILQRLLLKARERERERENTRDFTV
ncbi:hypothetical protein BBO99_00001228 [Phytophthora kernoviae]|uniref:HTH CENPB-type domain-containing protein n=2 Tax=Phytophthora kernoviae TaxID=325452 RepID=A0A3R7G050_9STRA|nr:hypothetical protein G195_005366 [Phytophthora kernoviae 00238/432]KAG2525213.1 hypothetical protein JM16_004559 [Phytophthora kernoviae]KAG2526838.1 hypothetical protein JM18_004135 [Phytophthora kernoviae]RLN14866.1 hypothetical protein BBI17_004635 [Phytophthora kernoviae]RLN84552.1 hypothetical protein BBO99_00001228 [Phytophthora kernoviae]